MVILYILASSCHCYVVNVNFYQLNVQPFAAISQLCLLDQSAAVFSAKTSQIVGANPIRSRNLITLKNVKLTIQYYIMYLSLFQDRNLEHDFSILWGDNSENATAILVIKILKTRASFVYS